MAKKNTGRRAKPSANRSRQANSTTFKHSLIRALIKLTFAVLILSGLALLYMDTHIRHQFEGKRWALPAKVYARPLELYAGLPLSINDLKIELKGLGYQFVQHAKLPGQAEFSSSRAIINSRGFIFPDGREQAQQLILSFSGDYLSDIRNHQAHELPLVRLEPVLIGGIYPLNNEDRDLIQLNDAPKGLIDALIAIEDRDFYDHAGISLKGITRALWANIKARRWVQGGSTLTQQLIKNFYLTSERSLARKLMEIPMAMLLELHYSKEDILQAYLNEVFLGQQGARAIHGFGLAAQYYFAQPIHELKLHQVALLAGLVKGPSYYDPRRHPQRAKQRRDLVLSVLYDQGSIAQNEYQSAISSNLDVVKQASLLKGAYPAYLDLVKRQLRRDYRDHDLGSEGLRIFTSLNPIAQYKAEKALVGTIEQLNKHYGKKLNELQGSMVVTEPQTGEVIAIIGGRSTRYQGFNRALDAVRPIGSLIKPAVYLTALQQGYTLNSPIDDSPYQLTMKDGQIWQPQNFDHQSHGRVPLYQSLAHSYNLATARLGMSVGIDNVITTLNHLGVTRPVDPYPSLLLGAQGLSVIEVANMYQTIAANGFQIPLRAIRTVTDNTGHELSRYPLQLKQTIDPDTVHLAQYMLQQVTRIGTARSLYQTLPNTLNIAGKTGTSDDQRDSWFAGFTGNRLAVVWLGQDNNHPLPFTGSGGALKAWASFISSDTLEPFLMTKPENIDYFWVDPVNTTDDKRLCSEPVLLPFIKGNGPSPSHVCSNKNKANDPLSTSIDWVKQWFR